MAPNLEPPLASALDLQHRQFVILSRERVESRPQPTDGMPKEMIND